MATEFNPQGKTFKQRLDAFVKDAKDTHKVTVRVDNGRTAEWQHKHHVAHMFLYNSYKSTTPANTDEGERTISWSHFSDPTVKWDKIRWEDFLRTKENSVPVKDGDKWQTGKEPDKDATKKNVKLLQTTAGIGSGGEAMVSAGLKPCGEPCKCGAGRSKHLDSMAADLNSVDIGTLTGALTKAKAGSFDDYLKKFGLHRPLLNHPTSPEKWHVEAN
ncbi:MAG: hypothetical protein AMJ53_09905 [Gammaproteobacteria bacterium SG8_11]|nr:MAG: hypothetical protein AMJ53_09905 [Gammaproteobacteria bacterium SG8_11]